MAVKIFFSGDYINSGEPNFLDAALKSIIRQHDLAVTNFEAPVDAGYKDTDKIKKAGPHLYQSVNSPSWLANAGFNICCLANNHMYDYGNKGLSRTIESIQQAGMSCLGAGLNYKTAYAPYKATIKGVNLGFYNACEAQFGALQEEGSHGGYAWINHPLIDIQIKDLKTKCDFVIIMVHAGLEDTPIPLIEWRRRYHQLCDNGADAIIAHHPHIPQGHEKYNNSHIFYSLGNFYFDSCGYENRSNYSYSISLNLSKSGGVSFKKITHKRIKGQTCLIYERQFDEFLEYLDSLLGAGYLELASEQSIYFYQNVFLDYYCKALLGGHKKTKFQQRIINVLKQIFFPGFKQDKRDLLLLHNIRIESNLYVAQRALSLISEGDGSYDTSKLQDLLYKTSKYY